MGPDQTLKTNLQQSAPCARQDTSLTRTIPRLPASLSAPSRKPRRKWHCGAVAGWPGLQKGLLLVFSDSSYNSVGSNWRMAGRAICRIEPGRGKCAPRAKSRLYTHAPTRVPT